MPPVLHYHPLSSYCWKVLIALYEAGTVFEPRLVDLGDAAERARLLDLWPIGKFPVLQDTDRDRSVPESSIIIEYLDRHHPGPRPLIPHDAGVALDARLWDRFQDLYIHAPLQRIVGDRLRPAEARDATGVAEARATLRTAYAMLERRMRDRAWAIGDAFSLADCAAAPALFYAGIVAPFPPDHPQLAAYLDRLVARPSVARVIAEARPYFRFFPFVADMPARFRDG
ncbi:MAG TPA: glutathione S-transferase family protein [Roseomonas sp.]|jgi:glutathione S-transferase